MKVSLVVSRGKRKGNVIPIPGPQFVIGRHKECQLRANGSTISQHHCAILLRQGKVFIHDFDSTNGTYVNQKRVHEEQELAPGDLLELGRLAFRVQIDADGEEPPVPPMKADESMVAAMLLGPSDSTDSAGILGLLEDSKCGSTILQNPFAEEEKPEPASRPEKDAEAASTQPNEKALPPAGQNEEIAKKLLDELHRSVRAKHNQPWSPLNEK
jgi:pSer/pThr/pTyr-binding forkhead associated (FHA) protein